MEDFEVWTEPSIVDGVATECDTFNAPRATSKAVGSNEDPEEDVIKYDNPTPWTLAVAL